MQAEELLKETKPAASVRKQPPAQENSAAVQPVKAAAAAEVSGFKEEGNQHNLINVQEYT